MTDPQPGDPDYWESLESDGDGRSVIDVVQDRTDDANNIQSIVVADEANDGSLFLLVVYTRLTDNGQLLLGERYFVFDPRDPDTSSYSGNGIERRVSGDLATALSVAYKAAADGVSDGPFTVEAVDGGIEQNPDRLTRPFEPKAPPKGSRDRDEQSRQDRDQATCKRCDQTDHVDNLKNIGASLGDVWVHVGDCPDPEHEQDGDHE